MARLTARSPVAAKASAAPARSPRAYSRASCARWPSAARVASAGVSVGLTTVTRAPAASSPRTLVSATGPPPPPGRGDPRDRDRSDSACSPVRLRSQPQVRLEGLPALRELAPGLLVRHRGHDDHVLEDHSSSRRPSDGSRWDLRWCRRRNRGRCRPISGSWLAPTIRGGEGWRPREGRGRRLRPPCRPGAPAGRRAARGREVPEALAGLAPIQVRAEQALERGGRLTRRDAEAHRAGDGGVTAQPPPTQT